MCGIAGIVGQPDRAAVARMAAAMTHRGPDEAGFYADTHAALGFRRLSIIDVTTGQQPLSNEDGALRVVFNGEIYNHRDLRRTLERNGHRLRTGSDGEVLAHLYEEDGDDLVHRLDGIFAFALWDVRRRRLLLARDPYGVKPLYYHATGSRLVFASEIKAILASGLVPREVDPNALAQYLMVQAVPPPLSILRDVRQLEPGARLSWNGQTALAEQFWTPPVQADDLVGSTDEARALVRDRLEAAVARQLMSERPLGVFLSGGVDSSTLVALAARATGHRLKTFSVGFIGPDERTYSEWPWARLVAERYDTEHHEFILDEQTFAARLPHVWQAMDQPTSDGINSYFVSMAAAEHVTVALSGTGADELFLGYDRDAALLSRFGESRLFDALPRGYLATLSRWLERVPADALWPRVRRHVDSMRVHGALDAELVSPRGIGIFDAHASARLLDRDMRAQLNGMPQTTVGLRGSVVPDPAHPGDWLARAEQRAYLSWVLLRDIDAMSMAHSLEVRVPFLDPGLVQAASRIPWQWKLRDGIGKWILREAVADLLPAETLARPKMGFGLPYLIWMRRPGVAALVRDVLAGSRVQRHGVLDAAETTTLVERFFKGDDTVWRQVWTLFVFEAWAASTL